MKSKSIDFSQRLLKEEFTACLEKWQGADSDNVFKEVLLLNIIIQKENKSER